MIKFPLLLIYCSLFSMHSVQGQSDTSSCNRQPVFNCNCEKPSSPYPPRPEKLIIGKPGPQGPRGMKGEPGKNADPYYSEKIESLQDELSALQRAIPRSCNDITGSESQSGNYVISPDSMNVKPFVVYCNFSSTGSTETIIMHDSTEETNVSKCQSSRCYSRDIRYHVKMQQIVALINISSSCSQFIKYRCLASVITHGGSNYAVWYSRDGLPQFYWGGATSQRKGYCACGEKGTCVDAQFKCNCDRNTGPETSDEGYLTDKHQLPVVRLQFGDTDAASESGWHTLGPLVCIG